MKRILNIVSLTILFSFLVAVDSFAETELLYSINISANTAGSHENLSRKAQFLEDHVAENILNISYGSLLGQTKIVSNDKGVLFLRTARDAGIKCVIPGEGELSQGAETFRMLTAYSDIPDFVAANILDERSRAHLVKPYLMTHMSDLKICFVGMADTKIIGKLPDKTILGIDILPELEAYDNIAEEIKAQHPDRIILTGSFDREMVGQIAAKHPDIDTYITRNRTGGFKSGDVLTESVLIGGKPVFIADDSAGLISTFAVSREGEVETSEFYSTNISKTPLKTALLKRMTSVIESLKKQEREETEIILSGQTITTILKEQFDVDSIALERQALYYYPLGDSLSLFNLPQLVKRNRRLEIITVTGHQLKTALSMSNNSFDNSIKLHIAGISDDGKIDDIPLQDDREYSVLTSAFLAKGGNGYHSLEERLSSRPLTTTLYESVEHYLLEKDERIREAMKKKIWALSMNLEIGSNFNRTNVDHDKPLYGTSPPKALHTLEDLFTGYFQISSWDDRFTVTKKKHYYEARLRARYLRSGYRKSDGDISYGEGQDLLQLYHKYTYDISSFKTKPFVGIDMFSELYYPFGRHPFIASARTGLSREIKSLMNMVIELSLDGTRDYTKNETTFGTTNTMRMNKSFPAKGLLTAPTKLSIDARMTWNPMARYHMAFYLINNNKIDVQVWKKFNLTFHVTSYFYRDTQYRKIASAFTYNVLLNYKMDWKI